MIQSFIFSQGKLVGQDLEVDALKLVRADKGLLIWVDLDCPTTEEIEQVLQEIFNFHPLAIEDCTMATHLTKLEDYEHYLFMVMHGVDATDMEKFVHSEMNAFIGREFLVTSHASSLPSLQIFKEKLCKAPRFSVRNGDRLIHMILDTIIDHYRPMINELTSKLEDLEDLILNPDAKDLIEEILAMRKELSELRRIVRPQREVINRIARGESKLVRAKLQPYFRDLHDDLSRIDEMALGYTERLMLDFDVYMNRTANEANEGIKVLTSLTAITLPPVIVGSWYGMNFRHFPELEYHNAYWVALGVTCAGVFAMWMWLKSKKWF